MIGMKNFIKKNNKIVEDSKFNKTEKDVIEAVRNKVIENYKKVESMLSNNARIILSKNTCLPVQRTYSITNQNSNTLLIGESGTGVMRYFIFPNMIANVNRANIICLDPAGAIMRDTRKVYEENGYKVKEFNVSYMKDSNKYNPFKYMTKDSHIISFVDILMKATSDLKKESFFDEAERKFLLAVTSLLVHYNEQLHLDKNFSTFLQLIHEFKDEDSKTNIYFEALLSKGWYFDNNDDIHLGKPTNNEYIYNEPIKDGNIFRYYNDFITTCGGKTKNAVMISLNVRLSVLEMPEVISLLSSDDSDDINLQDFIEEKTIMYIIYSSVNNSFDVLVNLLVNQTMEILMESSKISPYHCMFLLNQMDRISVTLPINVMQLNMYNASVHLMIPSIEQVRKSKYSDDIDIVLSGFDNIVCFGIYNYEVNLRNETSITYLEQIAFYDTNKAYKKLKKDLNVIYIMDEEIKSLTQNVDKCAVWSKGNSLILDDKDYII